jgi:NADH-quinone oxidoreductase subunit H
VLVAVLLTLFFFGGWQVPWLYSDGFHFGSHALQLPRALVVIMGVIAFWIKVVLFCWLQILIRWTLPRFRYDQLMALGWKGLVPLGLLNVLVTAFVVVLATGAAR